MERSARNSSSRPRSDRRSRSPPALHVHRVPQPKTTGLSLATYRFSANSDLENPAKCSLSSISVPGDPDRPRTQFDHEAQASRAASRQLQFSVLRDLVGPSCGSQVFEEISLKRRRRPRYLFHTDHESRSHRRRRTRPHDRERFHQERLTCSSGIPVANPKMVPYFVLVTHRTHQRYLIDKPVARSTILDGSSCETRRPVTAARKLVERHVGGR